MPRIGDTVRPELGESDFSGILQGGMAFGQGIAKAGAGIGDYLKKQLITAEAL
jgi:hypothetical protein